MKIDIYKKYKSVPVEIREVPGGAVLRRGTSRIDIGTPQGAASIAAILRATKKASLTAQGICDLFSVDSHTAVKRLIGKLIEWKLLVPEDSISSEKESNLDVFYWDFQESSKAVIAKFSKLTFVIIGVNYISRSLSVALMASGFNNIVIVDNPWLRNVSLFDKADKLHVERWPTIAPFPIREEDLPKRNTDCIILTSDFGISQTLFEWNHYCIDNNIKCFPVILHNLVGYVGPLIVPREIACFECAWSRLKSNQEMPELPIETNKEVYESQCVTGFHPSMTSVLGDIAAFQLTKFYTTSLAPREPGCLIEVHLLKGTMTPRKVLKLPRCAVCSSVNKTPAPAIDRAVFIPPKGWEI